MCRSYRVGEVACLFVVSVRTLRHYDERGLLVPSARSEAGSQDLPLKERAGGIANTDVMIMASALLRSANLAVFELGMWQSWTGR